VLSAGTWSGAWWTSRSLAALWVSIVPSWFCWSAVGIVIGWLVFSTTGSPALVGLSYTLRLVPLAIVAVPAGTLSDRVGRVPILIAANVVGIISSLVLIAALGLPRDLQLIVVLGTAVAFGCVDAVRLVVAANLSYDAVEPALASRAIGVSNLAAGLGQALGAFAGGALFDVVGATGTSVVVAALFLFSAIPLLLVPRRPPHDRTTSLRSQLREGIDLVRHDSVVGSLVRVAILAEMLGFAGLAMDPVFAGDVFAAGALGLGLISGTRAIGRLIGSAGLGVVHITRLGSALAGSVTVFGIALVAYAVSPNLWIALPAVLVAGVAGVVVDSLEQTGLQAGVSERHRGRAAGLWVFSLGLGPVGISVLTVLAAVTNPRLAQLIAGAALLAFGAMLGLGVVGRPMRQLSTKSTVIVIPELPPSPLDDRSNA
jgi:MFS family permease